MEGQSRREDAPAPANDALAREARRVEVALNRGVETPSTPGETTTEEAPAPPSLPGPAQPVAPTFVPLVGRSFVRWVWIGVLRLTYRLWTRFAVHAFPE
ncbi:MAG TPA: hypothetical protein VKQ36_16505, partial [Ktedonobacterales bacterium]|nr:hypothetical protein [Ktedonobacterales bacterium]